MGEKYIDERFPDWMVFGHYPPSTDVNVTNVNSAVDIRLSPEQAELLVQELAKQKAMLVLLAQELDRIDPNAFNKIWYGA